MKEYYDALLQNEGWIISRIPQLNEIITNYPNIKKIELEKDILKNRFQLLFNEISELNNNDKVIGVNEILDLIKKYPNNLDSIEIDSKTKLNFLENIKYEK